MCYPRNKPRTVKLLSERRGTKLRQQNYYPCKSDSADGTVEKQLKHLRKVKMFRRTISREINLQYNLVNFDYKKCSSLFFALLDENNVSK